MDIETERVGRGRLLLLKYLSGSKSRLIERLAEMVQAKRLPAG